MNLHSQNSDKLRRRIFLAFLPFAFCLLPFAFSAAQQPDVSTHIAAGRKLFSGYCGMGYCHGAEGVGGGGPKLRDRTFKAASLKRMILNGIPGTTMPAFKTNFNATEVDQITAYLLSLSPGKGDAPETAFAASVATPPPANDHLNPARQPPPTAAPASKPEPAATGTDAYDLRGDATAGRELFFASDNAQSCRACHTVQGRGGKVGPDLTGVASKTPREILQGIVTPHASIAADFAQLTVTTSAGERFTGVKRDETADTLRLWDLSSLPPVSRSLPKAEITKTEKLPQSAMPGDYAARHSLKQLLDLVAFLKTAGQSAPASVSLKDLF